MQGAPSQTEDDKLVSKPTLKELSSHTAGEMISRQALPSLTAVLKELLENSIDAGATKIRVRMGDFGKEFLEVVDDGSGLTHENLLKMCQFGATSKIDSHEDLQHGIEGFGFRGEGLAALKQAGDIHVYSRSREQPEHPGWFAIFSAKTELPVIEKSDSELAFGTKMRLDKPFINDKLRRDELLRSCKITYKDVIQLIQTYALIFLDKTFELSHFLDGRNTVLLNYNNESVLLERLKVIFGLETCSNLEEVNFSEDQIKITGFMTPNAPSGSFKTQGGLKKTETRLVVNNRPTDFPKQFREIINRAYSEYNPNPKFFVLLFLTVPAAWVDVNISKNKREVLLVSKSVILTAISKITQECLARGLRQPKMFNIDQVASPMKQNTQPASQDSGRQGLLRGWMSSQQISSNRKATFAFEKTQTENKSTDEEFVFRSQKTSNRVSSSSQNQASNSQREESQDAPLQHARLSDHSSRLETVSIQSPKKAIIPERNTSTEILETNEEPNEQSSSEKSRAGMTRIMNYEPQNHKTPSTSNCPDHTHHDTGKIAPETPDHPHAHILSELRAKDPRDLTLKEKLLSKLELNDRVGNSSKFTQQHFAQLEVIGQFNKGFIICKWKESPHRIFVIDQHAADEKHQFEKQFEDCKLKTQRLVAPMVVPVTFTEYLTVQENLKVFEDNGFILKTEKDEVTGGYRVLLWGVPNLTYWSYDHSDFRDLLYILTLEGAAAEDLMIPKLKREMATKACRAAVKIGDNLSHSTMHEIVAKMGQLKNPWSCPHGRPSTIIADGLYIPELDIDALKQKLKIKL